MATWGIYMDHGKSMKLGNEIFGQTYMDFSAPNSKDLQDSNS